MADTFRIEASLVREPSPPALRAARAIAEALGSRDGLTLTESDVALMAGIIDDETCLPEVLISLQAVEVALNGILNATDPLLSLNPETLAALHEPCRGAAQPV